MFARCSRVKSGAERRLGHSKTASLQPWRSQASGNNRGGLRFLWSHSLVPFLVNILLLIFGAYLCAGLIFAVPFVVVGAARLVPAARGATWGFRLVVFPGVVALWPWLAWRWSRGGVASERNAHRDRARQTETPS